MAIGTASVSDDEELAEKNVRHWLRRGHSFSDKGRYL